MAFRFIEEEKEIPQEEKSEKPSRFRFVEEEPSTVRSLLSAAPKGFLKEFATQLGKNPLVKALNQIPTIHPALETDVLDVIENLLPTQEGFTESALERGGRIAPYAAIGGGNLAGQALRSALAGFLGQGAEEIGLPDWAQSLVELPAFGLPGLGKKIIPKKGQEQLLEGARKLGLAEEEITPLIQSEKKQRILGKVAPRRGRTKKLLDKSYKALGDVYDRLETNPAASKELSSDASSKVLTSIQEQMQKFPSEVRKKIQEDFEDLAKSPITGSSLTNFFKDVNYYVGKGNSQLGVLKEPIFKALEDISPELANDFRITNKLYSNYSKISEKLKPSLISDLYSAGEAIRLLTGLSLGNFPLIGEMVGEHGARLLSRELLLNPRLQNLSSKMMNALNENKYGLATKYLDQYVGELQELNPEIAEKLRSIDFSSQLRKDNK